GGDQHVGGAGVEGEHVGWLASGGEDGDVSDAAEIQGDAAESCVAIQKVVGVGNQRRALATDGHVGGAEVGDGGDAGAGGDDGGFTDLERGGGGAAQIGDGRALMEDRLAVGAEEIDFLGGD